MKFIFYTIAKLICIQFVSIHKRNAVFILFLRYYYLFSRNLLIWKQIDNLIEAMISTHYF